MARRFAVAAVMLIALGVAGVRTHDQFRFVGTVVAIDAAKTRLSVKFKEWDGKDETVKIAIVSTTRITRQDKPVAKAEVKKGASVVVDALGDDYDSLEALDIRLVPPPSLK